MPNIVEMKTGDREPPLRAILLDKATRKPVNLTGCTATFSMSALDGTVKVVSGSATVEDAAGGIVAYPWADGDTDTAGEYNGEFKVHLPGGNVRTFPSSGYIRIVISESLG